MTQMRLQPFVPVEKEVVTLKSIGVAGSIIGLMISTGYVPIKLEQQAQVHAHTYTTK